MPIYGSRAPFADPRDSDRQMKKKARRQGHIPHTGPSSLNYLYKRFQQIGKSREVSAVQQRRVMRENELNYELEGERMMADLRRARAPAFRGEGARMMGVDRVADEILA
jgi:hypothetical protein